MLAALAALVLLPGCRTRSIVETPPDPFGPIRPIRDIRENAPRLTGQFVRLHGKITGVRNLNPGHPFPWDVVYTVDDGTGTLPVRWFTQEPAPKMLKPPTLPDHTVIVTGKLKRDLELEGKTYDWLVHELAEVHNRERPTLPATPTLR